MKLLILTAALALTGCSVGSSQWDSKAMDHTKVAFIGIPGMFGLGFTGTTTPITPTTSLTNKHVAYPTLRRIIDTHPHCDLALIKQDNSGEKLPPRLDYALPGISVTLYGYSGRTLLPVSGRGKVDGFEMYKGCKVAYTHAGSVQGMSGGAVFNDQGGLVGIIFGADILKGRTYFIPRQSFKPLID